MAVTESFTVSLIDVDTASGADFDIDQIGSVTLNPGIANAILSGAGVVDATFATVQGSAPTFTFNSPMVSTVLSNVGWGGLVVDSDADGPGVDAYLAQYDEGGTRKGASSHIKLTISEGIIVPRTLTASQGGTASINCAVITSYDGTNDPVVIATGVSLPTTASATEAFTLGPVDVDGTDLDGVQSVTVDFGHEVIVRSGDGDVFPTFVALGTRRPSITVTTAKSTYLSTTGIYGAEVSSSVVVYFRKKDEGGTNRADGTSTHVSITVSEGMVQPTSSTFGTGPGDMGFRVVPTYDGTNDTLDVSTTASLS